MQWPSNASLATAAVGMSKRENFKHQLTEEKTNSVTHEYRKSTNLKSEGRIRQIKRHLKPPNKYGSDGYVP